VLNQHVSNGNLIRIKKGLYATVPAGESSETFTPDPYLVATHMAEDAFVAYHSACQFHGIAHSQWNRCIYLTDKRLSNQSFRGTEFISVQVPAKLRKQNKSRLAVDSVPRRGGHVDVSSVERTLVDVFHRPKHSGSFEEIWRSMLKIEWLDMDEVIEYATALDNARTCASVGYFLDQNQEKFMLTDEHLSPLQELAPNQPTYLDTNQTGGTLSDRWNLIVPDTIHHQTWDEFA
jgi:predicted transcriptional regulator of viral defense system